jgi:hypothetical protein
MMLAHRQWADARAAVLAALSDGCRWVAVVGPPGVGKTMLLRDIARTLARESGKDIRNATPTAKHHMLIVAAGANGTALLDDADGLSETLLAGLSAPSGPRCVFAGSRELAGRLGRIVADTRIVVLDTLPPAEARAYLALWLEREQLSAKFFDPQAAAALIAAAQGSPRSLSKLAGRAVQIAASEDARRVGTGHVREAISPPADMPAPPPDEAAPEPVRQRAAVRIAAIRARLKEIARFYASPTKTPEPAPNGTPVGKPALALALAATLGVLVVPTNDMSNAAGTMAGAAKNTMARLSATVAAAAAAAMVRPASSQRIAARDTPPPSPPVAPSLPAPLAGTARAPVPIVAPVLAPSAVLAPATALPPPPTVALADNPARIVAHVSPLPSVVLSSPSFVGANLPALSAIVPRPAALPATVPPQPARAGRSGLRPAPAVRTLAAAFPVPDLASARMVAADPPPTSAPGLLLIVRGGETLGDLYARVYRGIVPPPFEEVAAANPKHFRPGDVLTFPPPPGGWKKPRTASIALP